MKKMMTLLVAMAMVLTLSCSSFAGEKLSGKKLVIGTMAKSLGLPVRQAQKAGYFKDAGLDVEVVIFATGAPINEAMAADELDVAVSGMATVYALATGRYKYIGDGILAIEGQTIYGRPGSDIVKAAGPMKNVLGDAKSVKGANILGPLATAAHYLSIKYVEAMGLTANDFNMVSMEFPQAYQAFVTGQGDLVATCPPFTSQLEQGGFIKVADLLDVTGSPLVDTIFVQNYVMDERRNDLKVFLDCYYRAAADVKNDPDLRRKVAMEWYREEGITYSDQDMTTEMQQQTYHTYDTVLTPEYPFGFTMTSIGEFFVGQGMIEDDMAENIPASLDPSLLEELKAAR